VPTDCDGQRDLPHFNRVADLRPRSEDVIVHKTDPLDEILSIPEAAQQLDLPERDVPHRRFNGKEHNEFSGLQQA